MTDLPNTLRELVETHHGDLPAQAQIALFELMRVTCEHNPPDSAAQGRALDAYLDAMDAGSAKSGPAREFAMASLQNPSMIASRMFYSRARSELDQASYQAVQRAVIDRIFIEAWPITAAEPAPPAAPAAETTRRTAFDDGDFTALMAVYFNRDRSYAIERGELESVLREVLDTLAAAMSKAGLDEAQQNEYRARFEAHYGSTIREHLAAIDAGTAQPGRFHFMG
ncbi:hypothetical protein [Maricaulis sp.]|uniref:hypothetical protein n=1 Tax=Maricaulis sp. TaxID=1486257 RepID=UPI00260E551F|nr:hypothetical protein [Maricaulis sp.]